MQKQRNGKLLYGFAAGLVTVGLVFGMTLQGHSQAKTEKAQAEEPPLVRALAVKASGAAESYIYAGEVRGRYESQLAFQVGGKIIKRQVELGSVVKAGDILMQIDPKDIQQAVATIEAQVASAEAQLKLAQENLKRYEQLYKQKLVSRADYDRYQMTADTAEAMLRQARSQYADSRNKANYCNLVADNAGVVASVTAEAGQVVSAGLPVVTVVRDNEREVEINVPENRVEDIRKAQQLQVTFWALPDVTGAAKLREIAPMADKVSRTYKVRVSLLNPPKELKLGMTAKVTVADAGNQAAVSIPLSAIYQTGDTPAVWVVTNGTVNLRPIKVGAFGNEQVQVLEGLKEGDLVVTAGVHKLREGQKVRTGGDAQ